MQNTEFRSKTAHLRKNLKAIGCKNIQFRKGYEYFSGLFTAPNGQEYYICSGDLRGPYRLYYRGVRNRKDYTGFVNQSLNGVTAGDFANMKFYDYSHMM